MRERTKESLLSFLSASRYILHAFLAAGNRLGEREKSKVLTLTIVFKTCVGSDLREVRVEGFLQNFSGLQKRIYICVPMKKKRL